MKNYADELFYEELSSTQKEIVKVTKRIERIDRFLENFLMPAISGVSKTQEELQGAPASTQPPEVQPSEDEIVAHRKVEQFGQVLPIEDVEEVIDMIDSITRFPCGWPVHYDRENG